MQFSTTSCCTVFLISVSPLYFEMPSAFSFMKCFVIFTQQVSICNTGNTDHISEGVYRICNKLIILY